MSTIVVSVDREGLSHISQRSQLVHGTSHYEQAQQYLREDLTTVLDLLIPSEFNVVVVDAYGEGLNIQGADVLPATLLQGNKLPWGIVEGVQRPNVKGVILLGYHGCAGSRGVLAHTVSPCFTEVKVNGKLAGEVTLAALLARQAKVPVLGVSGDDFCCQEALSLLGKHLPVAEVKRALGYEAIAQNPNSKVLLQQMTQQALELARRATTMPRGDKQVIEVKFGDFSMVDTAILVPGSEQLDLCTVKYEGPPKACYDVLRLWAQLAHQIRRT